MTKFLSSAAKAISTLSRKFNFGNGSTWPGHIALKLNPHIIEDILKKSKTNVILVVGTNGKTTTGKVLSTILSENHQKVIQNMSGANLLNGIASSLLLNTNPYGRLNSDYAVFEVDENNLPIVLTHLTPTVIIALDLFRDQLDRYGELDTIAKKWNSAFKKLTPSTTLILNADDPLIAYLAKEVSAKVMYFGLSDKEKGSTKIQTAADSIYCPNCGHKLSYKKVFFSHLGIWECPNCHVKRPLPSLSESYYPLPGTYNKYNTLAAVLAAKELNISQTVIEHALEKVTPAFGRQEKLEVQGKTIQLFLSKNPTSMNEGLKTIIAMKAKHVLFVLNDRIPDGKDISWIWDIDIESFVNSFKKITVSGDRTYDMALRLLYADNTNMSIEADLTIALKTAMDNVSEQETLFILPTYSAMLDVRKILTGKKIL